MIIEQYSAITSLSGIIFAFLPIIKTINGDNMKFRNRFLKYARPQFSKFTCFVDDGGGDSGGSDNAGSNNAGSNNAGSDNKSSQGFTMTDSQFRSWLDTQNKAPAGNDKAPADKGKAPQSAYDRIKAEEQSKIDSTNNESDIRNTVKFDMSFDAFIKDNAKSFDTDVDKFRQGSKGLEGGALQSSLSCTASKSFFAKSENLLLLPEHEQQYIKNKVIGIADNAVDSAKAWQLLCDAIHVKNRINQSTDFKKNGQSGGHGDNTNTPAVTDYIDKCMARGKSATA